MAQYAIQITKSIPFQGVGEEFSNVYTLDTGALEAFDDVAAIDALVAIEKAVFTNLVTFVKAASYGIAGPAVGNVMREIKDLTGTGSISGFVPIYRECAVMVTFDLPRSAILKRRRIGRKWLHLGGLPNGAASPGAGQENGSAAFSANWVNWFKGEYVTPLVNGTFGGADFASGGDQFTNGQVHPYLEHRQFHR